MSEKVDTEDAKTHVKRKLGRMRGRIRLDPVELIREDRDQSISAANLTRGETIVRRLKGKSSVEMSTEEILALTRR